MYVYTFNNSTDQVPAVGFGTWSLKGDAGIAAIKQALTNGYTYLDGAFNYDNEATVGEAIRQSGKARNELIIASHLPGRSHPSPAALATSQESRVRPN